MVLPVSVSYYVYITAKVLLLLLCQERVDTLEMHLDEARKRMVQFELMKQVSSSGAMFEGTLKCICTVIGHLCEYCCTGVELNYT